MAAITAVAATTGLSALSSTPTAAADSDTHFTNELHVYGIYGEKDYNAWIAKITCRRLATNLDQDANASAHFVRDQLAAGARTDQVYQFLAAALRTYCPENLPILSEPDRPPGS